MPKSPAFIRIKRDVLAIVAAVPTGRVVTFADIGRHLDVMPRHVAYIVATLDPLEKSVLPWHRVVAADGDLGTPKVNAEGRTQAELLAADGVAVEGGRRLRDPVSVTVAVAALPHGVPPQSRPTDMADGGTGR